jgi:hypothetical protein
MQSMSGIGANTWNTSGLKAYQENVTYDPNGNIQTYVRRDGAETVIDNLAYKYDATKRNRLTKVEDTAPLTRSVTTTYSLSNPNHTRASRYVNTFRRRVSNRNTSGERRKKLQYFRLFRSSINQIVVFKRSVKARIITRCQLHSNILLFTLR